jgi:hypothetical protein
MITDMKNDLHEAQIHYSGVITQNERSLSIHNRWQKARHRYCHRDNETKRAKGECPVSSDDDDSDPDDIQYHRQLKRIDLSYPLANVPNEAGELTDDNDDSFRARMEREALWQDHSEKVEKRLNRFSRSRPPNVPRTQLQIASTIVKLKEGKGIICSEEGDDIMSLITPHSSGRSLIKGASLSPHVLAWSKSLGTMVTRFTGKHLLLLVFLLLLRSVIPLAQYP